MIYTFRSVKIGVLGKCVGYGDDGIETVVIVPCLRGSDGQLVNAEISVELEDGAWSDGVLTVYRTGTLTSDWVALSTPKTIDETAPLTQILAVDFPYLGVAVTTANASAAYATMTITTTDGGNV